MEEDAEGLRRTNSLTTSTATVATATNTRIRTQTRQPPSPNQIHTPIPFSPYPRQAKPQLILQMSLDQILVPCAQVHTTNGEFVALGWVGLGVYSRLVKAEVGGEIVVVC